MKKKIVSIAMAGMLLLVLQSFMPEAPSKGAFPDEITTILKSSCYDCHTTGAKSEDALKAVNFDQWDEYRLTKKIGVLGDLGKVVEKGKMPPAKYIEKKPEAKMTEAQKKYLVEWTQTEAEKLMQEN